MALATLTLPGPTSSGKGAWQNAVESPLNELPPPTLTGDPFTFTFFLGYRIGPPDFGTSLHRAGLHTLVEYDIAWTEIAGQLQAISVCFLSQSDEFAWNGRCRSAPGDIIASDLVIDGCSEDGTCHIDGFWQSNLAAVPEPRSIAPLVIGLALAGLLAIRGRRTP